METQLKEHGQREGNESERPQTMSDVCDSEIRYRRLFETAQDGILILDAESDANPYLIRILGYAREELIGKRLWEVSTFIDRAASKSALKNCNR
jgi:PAS domain S-box-containing protein